MKKIDSVESYFIVVGFISIYVQVNGKDEGKTVAFVDSYTGRVLYKDNDYRVIPEVTETILEVLSKLENLVEIVEVCSAVDKEHKNEDVFEEEMLSYFSDCFITEENKKNFIGFSKFHYVREESTVYANMIFHKKLDK